MNLLSWFFRKGPKSPIDAISDDELDDLALEVICREQREFVSFPKSEANAERVLAKIAVWRAKVSKLTDKRVAKAYIRWTDTAQRIQEKEIIELAKKEHPDFIQKCKEEERKELTKKERIELLLKNFPRP